MLASAVFLFSSVMAFSPLATDSVHATATISELNQVFFGGVPSDNFAACALEAYAEANSTTLAELAESFDSGSGFISEESFANVTTISCNHATELKIALLDVFPKLEVLDLSSSTIASFDGFYHPSLRELNLVGASFVDDQMQEKLITFALDESSGQYSLDLSPLQFLAGADPADQHYQLKTVDAYESTSVNLDEVGYSFDSSTGIVTSDDSYHARALNFEHSPYGSVDEPEYRTLSVYLSTPCVGVGISFDADLVQYGDHEATSYLAPQACLALYYLGDIIDSDDFIASATKTAENIASDNNKLATLEKVTLAPAAVPIDQTVISDPARITYAIPTSPEARNSYTLVFHFTTADKIKAPNTGAPIETNASLSPTTYFLPACILAVFIFLPLLYVVK